MINSFFLLTAQGDVIVEKHWRHVLSRNILDQFMAEVRKASDPEELLPIIALPRFYLIHIYRNGLFYLAILTQEVYPLMVIEFLYRVADTFQEYFGEVNEGSVKNNFVTVYELLEEMMDNGFPLTTETGLLREMILPPTLVNRVVTGVTGQSNVQNKVANSTMSGIPWRKIGIKHPNNEIYVDIVEEVDCIVENNGNVVSSEIQGEILGNCKLSGMPDLALIFMNPRILDDVSFHPCVRINRWERERVVSFIPPDGHFKLMNYRVNTGTSVILPLAVKPQIFFTQGTGKIDISVNPRNTGGKQIENVMLSMKLPPSTTGATLSANFGKYEYNPTTKELKWFIGRIPKDKLPMLSGNVVFPPGSVDSNPVILVQFKINMYAISGLKVNTLQITQETYKPYKGVRSITKSGKYTIRT